MRIRSLFPFPCLPEILNHHHPRTACTADCCSLLVNPPHLYKYTASAKQRIISTAVRAREGSSRDVNLAMERRRPSSITETAKSIPHVLPGPEQEPPAYGILTRTLIHSPVVKQIISARIRSRNLNDVLFIGVGCFRSPCKSQRTMIEY